MPVGSAPVVVKTTGEPVTRPCAVHVTTAGVAIVMVTVAVPTAFEKAVDSTILPAVPVPVGCDPVMVRSWPAVFDVPATTDCTESVCATGAAASAAPRRRLAAARRVINVS
jgi:hypothetical protein